MKLSLTPVVLALAALAVGCMTTTTTTEEIEGAKKPGEVTPSDPNAPSDPNDGLGPSRPLELSAQAKALLGALGDSTWHGMGVRNGKKRVIEHYFRANRLQWGEVQNPFGPGRKRELRTFTIRPDASIHAVVTNAASWKDGTPNGTQADYTLEIIPGTPRKLKVTSGTTVEELIEGPEPAPTSGFTATVRTFASAGPVDDAFCRRSYFSAIDYTTVFNFARFGRDKSAEHELGSDFVVGAKLGEWRDDSGANRFSVRDIPGFDRDGGSDLTDQQNFFVHYKADLVHPGGTFAMREMDDGVEDAVWAFVGPTSTSNLPNDLFLEVHDRPYADWTVDEPVKTFAAGKVPLEIFVARCGETIKTVTVQGRIGNGPWTTFDYVPTVPVLDPKQMQPPL